MKCNNEAVVTIVGSFLYSFLLPVDHRLFVEQGAVEPLIYILSLFQSLRHEGTYRDLGFFYFFICMCVCQSFKSLNSALPFFHNWSANPEGFSFCRSARNSSVYFSLKALKFRQGIVVVNLKIAEVSTCIALNG